MDCSFYNHSSLYLIKIAAIESQRGNQRELYFLTCSYLVARAIGVKKKKKNHYDSLPIWKYRLPLSAILIQNMSFSNVTLVRSRVPITSIIACRMLSLPLFAEAWMQLCAPQHRVKRAARASYIPTANIR